MNKEGNYITKIKKHSFLLFVYKKWIKIEMDRTL